MTHCHMKITVMPVHHIQCSWYMFWIHCDPDWYQTIPESEVNEYLKKKKKW